MPQLVPPHGSQQVKPLLLVEAQRAEERQRAQKLKKIALDTRTVSDVFMLAMGAYTPLDGFMGHDDCRGSCLDMKLTNGVFWPIPITLSVDKDLAGSLRAEEEVALTDRGWHLKMFEDREKHLLDGVIRRLRLVELWRPRGSQS